MEASFPPDWNRDQDCPVCDSRLSNSKQLNRHYRDFHSVAYYANMIGKKEYIAAPTDFKKCDICDIFVGSVDFEQHIQKNKMHIYLNESVKFNVRNAAFMNSGESSFHFVDNEDFESGENSSSGSSSGSSSSSCSSSSSSVNTNTTSNTSSRSFSSTLSSFNCSSSSNSSSFSAAASSDSAPNNHRLNDIWGNTVDLESSIPPPRRLCWDVSGAAAGETTSGVTSSLPISKTGIDWLGRNDPLKWDQSEWIGEVVNSPVSFDLEDGEQNDAPTLMQSALDWRKYNYVRIVGYEPTANDVVRIQLCFFVVNEEH